MRHLLAVGTVLAFILAGCANPAAQFYSGQTKEQIARYGSRTPIDPPALRSVSDMKSAIDTALEDGYILVGSSTWNGPGANPNQAIQQGRKVGADLIFISSRYTNTVNSAIPLTLPTTSTTYSSGTATAYGAGGTVTAYGTGVSTTQGSQTTMIPVSTDRFAYGVAYLIKAPYAVMGTLVALPNADQRAKFGTNRGLYIAAVQRGTPAFRADIMTGDLLVSVGGKPTDSLEDWEAVKRQYNGQTMDVVTRRGTVESVKSITLNPIPAGQ